MNSTTVWRRIAAVCMAGAAAIHLGVSGAHFSQWWLFGVFFLVVAAAQLAWAMLAWMRPDRGWLLGGMVGSLALLALWLVSRTLGLPIGPEQGTAEPFGPADSICAAFELAAVAFAALALRRAGVSAAMSSGRAAVATAVASGLVLVGSGVAIAMPGEHHDVAGHASSTHADPSHSESTPDPAAGTTATPGHSHDKTATGNGSRQHMANLPDVSTATPEQTAAAADLVARLKAATAAYRDVAAAKKAGFDIDAAVARYQRKHPDAATDSIPALHVGNKANRGDGAVADPTRPETLIYRRSADGSWMLVGVMFTAEKSAPPSTYQPYLRWHFHEVCRTAGAAPGAKKTKVPAGENGCAEGTKAAKTGYMTHVWFVPQDNLREAYAMRAPRALIQAYQSSVR